MIFRLICKADDNYPWGVYAGTDRLYLLQYRLSADQPWTTVPVVDWRTLTADEQKEIIESQKP